MTAFWQDSSIEEEWRALSLRGEARFRRRAFPGVSAAGWADWRWQWEHRVSDPAEVARLLSPLSPGERRGLASPAAWRMPLRLTPYALALLAAAAPGSPLRRTLLPDTREARRDTRDILDPLGENAHLVAPQLVCAYPHKALLLVSTSCAATCRYCTRARTAPLFDRPPPGLEPAFRWLETHPGIHDVLLSGGDPLALSDDALDAIFRRLRAIPHVDFLRIGTKMPAMLPQRVTPSLVRILRRHRLWLSLHFSHPAELTQRAEDACLRLSRAGVPLMNQCVLLRGVNDRPGTLAALFDRLLRVGVRPYYLHYADRAAGTAHFRASKARGRALLRAMDGALTGYAVPRFMEDPPPGGGKHPL